jgi:hypothetical protein
VPCPWGRLYKLPFAIVVRGTMACLLADGCRGQIRTGDFMVMSHARYQLLYSAKTGGSGRGRTFDACAFNATLYQLSYRTKNLFR